MCAITLDAHNRDVQETGLGMWDRKYQNWLSEFVPVYPIVS